MALKFNVLKASIFWISIERSEQVSKWGACHGGFSKIIGGSGDAKIVQISPTFVQPVLVMPTNTKLQYSYIAI